MATVWEEAANEALYKEYSSEKQVTWLFIVTFALLFCQFVNQRWYAWFMFITNRHSEFEVGTVKHIRLMFYIEGPNNKGTVHVEAKQVFYFDIQINNFPEM